MYAKFRVVIFIILLLPLLILSSNVRKRRRPGVNEQSEDSNESAYPDQLALATNYRHQDYVGLSSGYSSNENTENQHHRYHMIKPSEETSTEDPQAKFFEENLANTKSAHEYVEKALMLHGKHELTITNTVPTAAALTKSKPNPEINVIPKASSPRYEVYEGEQTESPAPFYDKDSVTRSSYDLFDFNDNEYQRQRKPYSGYSTVRYEPLNFDQHGYNREEENQKNEDHLQASPSEMPKEEILRHIEESVIKYMKTLESEGKIPKQEPKIYYKIQHQSIDPAKSYSSNQKGVVSQSETAYRMHHATPTPPMKVLMNEEPIYQPANPSKEAPENLQENVEFVYKIKTRSPGVREKYKNQGQKQQQQQNNPGNFDHKPFQGFDYSHLIPEDRPTKAKLFFNTETYRDINSLPYKPEKILVRHEHKEREQRRPPVEYKSFPNHQEAGPQQYIQINDHQVNQGVVDEGYPVGNPYRFLVHKEPKHEPENGLIVQPSNWQPYNPNKEFPAPQFDSYNPKFNNNPEGFGYQHNYKSPDSYGAHSMKTPVRIPKRGKRGQTHSKKPVRNFSANKDPEANVALRPPPKNSQR